VNAELLRYGPEVQGVDAMALLAEPVVELEGRLAGLQAKRQRFFCGFSLPQAVPVVRSLRESFAKRRRGRKAAPQSVGAGLPVSI
jgi:hypothetical protein